MKKIIVLVILIMLNCGNYAGSEELPQRGYRWTFNAYHNPVYYKYMDDYMNQLGEVFENCRYTKKHMGTSYDYVIRKDGTICNLKRDLWDSKRLTEIVRKIIINNPPPPFYEGMDVEELNISVFIGNESYENYDLDYYPSSNEFNLIIIIKR